MNRRVVVVEDEPSVLRMLQDVLQNHGCTVMSVAYPELVHTLDEKDKPDIFLLDMMLSGMSGVELAFQLREGGYRDTPMIAMSASPLMLELAVGAGLFQGTLSKPFDLSKLLAFVDRYAA